MGSNRTGRTAQEGLDLYKVVKKEIIKSKKSLFFQKTVIFLTLSGIILL